MRDPKINELNEDLKISTLKNNIMQLISNFKLSPTIIAFILKDIYQQAEQTKQQYLEESANELQKKIEAEEEILDTGTE